MDDGQWKEMFVSVWQIKGNAFIQFLLDTCFDVNALNKHGKTLLSYAAECGNMEIVEFLVQRGADGNVKNSNSSLPLHMAAKNGHQEVVKFFLDLGISADSRDDDDNTPLHYIVTGHMNGPLPVELMHLLLNSNADLDAVNKEGYTPLLLLLATGWHAYLDFVQLFIRLGANVHRSGPGQVTLVHYCCILGWSRMLRSLIERESDIDLDVINADGLTPLALADEYSNEDIIKLLIESGAKVEDDQMLLCYASQCGMLDTVKDIVRKGCDLNAKSSKGFTPLHLASYWSHPCVVEYLIDSGADVNCLDNYGRTPLHFACASTSLDVVKALTKAACDLNVQDRIDCETPLNVAVRFEELEFVMHLLEAGADCNMQNEFQSFLLSEIICLEGIELFLENGAYFQSNYYTAISWMPLVREFILQDLNLCTQAFLNKFNADLLKIYKIPEFSQSLPPVQQLNMVNKTNTTQDIAQSISHEIQTKGYCNVLELCPINLAIFSVESLVKHYCT